MSRVLTRNIVVRNIVVRVLVAAGAAWVLGSAVGAATIGTGARH